MKHTAYYSSLILTVMSFCFSACSDYDIPSHRVPSVEMAEATAVTRTSAVVHAYAGEAKDQILTFEYGESGSPYVPTSRIAPSGDSVHYTLTGLLPGRTYECRLCCDNGRVKVRSREMTFSTLSNVIPTVSSLTPMAKGPTSVIVEYTVLDNGGEDVISSGCRLRNVSTGHTADYSASQPVSVGQPVRVSLTGLDHLSTFQLTAYASNTKGTAEGSPLLVSTDNTISLSAGGMLQSVMEGDAMHYSSLSFSGMMNGDDFRHLRTMTIDNLNIADIDIIEGGGAYIPSRFTRPATVGYGMFSGLPVRVVVLPITAETVEEQAFKDCSQLVSITMPVNAVSIFPSDGCDSLREIIVPPGNSHYRSESGILYNADMTAIVWLPLGLTGEVALPSTITAIGDYAFRGCRFTSFVMPSSVKEMGQAAFYGSMVEKVVLSDALTKVPSATFQQCSRLSEVHLGSATQLLGDYVFDSTGLTDLYVSAVYPPVCGKSTFASTDGNDLFSRCTLHVPAASRSMYRQHQYWGKFSAIVSKD